MKRLFFLLLLIPIGLSGQIHDDFSDHDLRLNPHWKDDSGHFETADTRLHLRGPSRAGSSCISTYSKTTMPANWSFVCELGFNPSSSNYARVYLIKDSLLESGYYVQIGGVNDDICLYKQFGSQTTLLIDGPDRWLDKASSASRIQLAVDSVGDWVLAADSLGGYGFIELGRAKEPVSIASGQFMIKCVYTSTRADKFWFDDVEVNGDSLVTKVTGPQPGEIVISELMPDPSPPVLLPNVEYLELCNRSERPLELQGSSILGETILRSIEMQPHSWLLICDSAAISLFDSSIHKLGLDLGSSFLSNDGKLVELVNAEGFSVCSVSYTGDWYRDQDKSDGGFSLELGDVLAENVDDAGLWRASFDVSGGTPGRENSVRATQTDSDLLSIGAEIFHPTLSSLELSVSTQMEEMRARLLIYTKDGRLQRTLMNYQAVFGTAKSSWDGRSDKGELSPAGIYIAYAELIAPNGWTKKASKVVVIGL